MLQKLYDLCLITPPTSLQQLERHERCGSIDEANATLVGKRQAGTQVRLHPEGRRRR